MLKEDVLIMFVWYMYVLLGIEQFLWVTYFHPHVKSRKCRAMFKRLHYIMYAKACFWQNIFWHFASPFAKLRIIFIYPYTLLDESRIICFANLLRLSFVRMTNAHSKCKSEETCITPVCTHVLCVSIRHMCNTTDSKLNSSVLLCLCQIAWSFGNKRSETFESWM